MSHQNLDFTPPPYGDLSPLQWYDEAATCPGFIHDAAQRQAIVSLNVLWEELLDFKKKRNQFLGRSLRAPNSPKGLYMWGGVGRGKSFLMDTFFGCLPYTRKKRVHFHAFMVDLHARINRLKDHKNPLSVVIKEITNEVRVLCFDEFHVSDIADAMILGRLLEGLFKEGVILVATSNFPPDELYHQGQNRSRFLPTIDLIKNNLEVMNVDSGEDYRLRTLKPADVYYLIDETENEKLDVLFSHLSASEEALPSEMKIMGREILAIKRTQDMVWFDFRALFFSARSQQDYLFLAQNYHYVFISGVEAMTPNEKNEARRFTWAIDIFYDFKVKLCMSLEVPLDKIYTEGDFAEEFTRTVSRMQEMQSEHYLALPHLTLDEAKKNHN